MKNPVTMFNGTGAKIMKNQGEYKEGQMIKI